MNKLQREILTQLRYGGHEDKLKNFLTVSENQQVNLLVLRGFIASTRKINRKWQSLRITDKGIYALELDELKKIAKQIYPGPLTETERKTLYEIRIFNAVNEKQRNIESTVSSLVEKGLLYFNETVRTFRPTEKGADLASKYDYIYDLEKKI